MGPATPRRWLPLTCPPPWVVRAHLSYSSAPVHERCAIELVLEAVEESVDAGHEADRGRAGKALVYKAKERALAFRGELPANKTLLALWEFPPGLDVPLVLEHPRRLPHEYLPRDMVLGGAAPVVDAPPCACVEAGRRHVPAREVLRLGQRVPYDLSGMRDASLERDRGEVALERQRASSRGVRRRHVDSSSLVCVPGYLSTHLQTAGRFPRSSAASSAESLFVIASFPSLSHRRPWHRDNVPRLPECRATSIDISPPIRTGRPSPRV